MFYLLFFWSGKKYPVKFGLIDKYDDNFDNTYLYLDYYIMIIYVVFTRTLDLVFCLSVDKIVTIIFYRNSVNMCSTLTECPDYKPNTIIFE